MELLYIYTALLLIFMKILISFLYVLGIHKTKKEVDIAAIVLLFFDLIVVIVSFFTNSHILLFPFFMVLNLKYYPYINIVYFILNIILLLPYNGVDDYFEKLHRVVVAIYFITYIPFLVLL